MTKISFHVRISIFTHYERMSFIEKIIVIDAPCGAGKTSWAIQYIKEHTEDSFVYCTPFLDEIDRIREACGTYRFREPNNYESTKIESFNELLAVGTDIAVTHSTFINATPETKELIEQGEYTMLLDEALEVVVDFNKITSVERAPEQRVSAGDIRMMKDKGLIRIGDNCLVEWIGDEYKDSKLSEVERLAKLHRLYCARGRLLVCIFPPDIFQKFKQVYVMTYMVGGTDLQRYFDLFGIDYTLSSVVKNGNRFELIPYSQEIDYIARRKYKELITICDVPRLNQGYKRTSLTKTWYKSCRQTMPLSRMVGLYNLFFGNFNGDLQAFGRAIPSLPGGDELEFDHVNSCANIGCCENLVPGPKGLNQTKHELSKYFQLIGMDVFPIADGEGHILVEYYSSAGRTLYRRCESPEAFLNWLQVSMGKDPLTQNLKIPVNTHGDYIFWRDLFVKHKGTVLEGMSFGEWYRRKEDVMAEYAVAPDSFVPYRCGDYKNPLALHLELVRMMGNDRVFCTVECVD